MKRVRKKSERIRKKEKEKKYKKKKRKKAINFAKISKKKIFFFYDSVLTNKERPHETKENIISAT